MKWANDAHREKGSLSMLKKLYLADRSRLTTSSIVTMAVAILHGPDSQHLLKSVYNILQFTGVAKILTVLLLNG